MPLLDSISWDTSDLHLEGDGDGVRVWHTERGDAVSLHYFSLPPDIGADLESIDEVWDFYRQACVNAGGAIIEVDNPVIDSFPATRTIIKVPQQPHGMSYVGSITLPRRDFSFVVKIQCSEQGTTGIRDSVIGELTMRSGQVRVDNNGEISGWWADPYDPTFESGLARNLGEDEKYDVDFPDHPLSRLRPILRRIEGTLRVAADVKAEPRFVFARSQKPRRRWSRFFS